MPSASIADHHDSRKLAIQPPAAGRQRSGPVFAIAIVLARVAAGGSSMRFLAPPTGAAIVPW
jgi:hypothetical protein